MKNQGYVYLLVLGIVISCTPNDAGAERIVRGQVTMKSDGSPVPGARVRAWDADTFSGDDEMGEDITDSGGYYQITYRKGHWDNFPHFMPAWRPDIFITVALPKSGGGWERVFTSQSVKRNWKVKLDLDRNAKLMSKSSSPGKTCDKLEGSQIACDYGFLDLRINCKACSTSGNKYEWSHWFESGSANSREVTQERCGPVGSC